jgi:hypothetical protein
MTINGAEGKVDKARSGSRARPSSRQKRTATGICGQSAGGPRWGLRGHHTCALERGQEISVNDEKVFGKPVFAR